MTEAYLGHRNIQNTTRYTALAPESVQNLLAGLTAQPECPLWVKSRHRSSSNQCPLYPQKRTLELSRVMSALCTLSELSIIENIAGHTARPLLRFAAVQFFKRVQHPTGLAPKGRFIATEAIEREIG